MSKARDLASQAPTPSTVSATELGYLDGVSSGIQTQIDGKSGTAHSHASELPSQTGNSGKYLTTNGSATSWGALSTAPGKTAKIPSGAAGGVYTFTSDFPAGQYMVHQSGASSISFGSNTITASDTLKVVNVSSNQSSLTIDAGNIAVWPSIKSLNGSPYWMTNQNGTLWLSGDGRYYTSTDGVTWTENTFTGTVYSKILYLNGVYFFGWYNGTVAAYYSTNGTSWTQASIGFANGYPAVGAATCAGITNKYLLVGNGGKWAYSTNGTSWTYGGSMFGGSLTAATSNQSNLYVAVGTSGAIYTSPNATTWTSRTSPVAVDWADVEYGNGLYVAVGQTGNLITSPDGVTWTSRTTGTTGNISRVSYVSGATYPWFAQTENGKYLVSSDGITWSVKTVTTTINSGSGILYYGGKYFFAGYDTVGGNKIFSATNALGATTSDYYATFVGPNTVTTLS